MLSTDLFVGTEKAEEVGKDEEMGGKGRRERMKGH